MNPLLRRNGGDWIGWAGGGGEEDIEQRRAILAEWAEKDHYFAVDLPEDVAAGFYEGYANQTLWPVFHNFPSQLKFDAKGWESYVEANRIFCDAVVDRYKPGDLIWVHDYHLMLLPQMLRDRLPDAAIGFFLHIPFPSSEIFPVLPRREELLKGLAWSGPARISDPRVFAAIPRCAASGAWHGKQDRHRSPWEAVQFVWRRFPSALRPKNTQAF